MQQVKKRGETTHPRCFVLHENAVGDVAELTEVALDVVLVYRLILQPFKQINLTRILIFPLKKSVTFAKCNTGLISVA